MKHSHYILIAASLLIFSSCVHSNIPTRAQAEARDFDTAAMCLVGEEANHTVTVELATDFDDRAVGLMFREALPEDEGMLFYYPGVAQRGFWMYQTLIPLDIAFLNSAGQILEIQTMEPCMSDDPRLCQPYPSSYRFRAALEMNEGFFAAAEIREGDYALDGDCEQVLWHQWD